MGRRFLVPALIIGLLAGAALPALAAHNGNSHDNNVAICHKGRTIHVSPRAVPAHVAHGDTSGACTTPTPTAAEVATNTPGPEPTATDTPEPAATETPEPAATETPEPTATPTA